ncbi:hypothetical protein SK224_07975 [Microbacterium sp. BG28]|uniref:hypothetical protein n=1 Tax=Microbacterium sp. BG28 TaxID=3097356 RepID=UPI002A5A2918|nr:hypothetical protein [Microbacterium sp. BG28]MDY0829064.1 hypothetical protein [Microbacterium sp. BG28]
MSAFTAKPSPAPKKPKQKKGKRPRLIAGDGVIGATGTLGRIEHKLDGDLYRVRWDDGLITTSAGDRLTKRFTSQSRSLGRVR